MDSINKDSIRELFSKTRLSELCFSCDFWFGAAYSISDLQIIHFCLFVNESSQLLIYISEFQDDVNPLPLYFLVKNL